MPRYMVQVRFSEQAVRGLLNQGGSARRASVEKSIANLGGSVEAYYFTFGAQDAVVIVDLPDNATAAAVGMAVGASGAGSTTTTPLLTCEEMDAAARIEVDYRPPGE